MGSPEFAVPTLEALQDAGHEIAQVYTQPPRPAGRGKAPRPTAVAQRAAALGLEVHWPPSLRDEAVQAGITELGADAAVVVAYGLILPRAVLAAPRLGCLNVHASLLPRWRGAAPIHRAVLAGDAETGISIMQMDEGLDTGPVLMRRATAIGPEETTGDLEARLAALGAAAIVEVLDEPAAFRPEPQPETGATYAAKIDKAEAEINWTRSAAEVDRRIRGLSPVPGAWTMAGAERLKLLRSRVVPGEGAPGEVLEGFRVACGRGAVEITEAQRQGRRPMPAGEVLRGLSLPERLGRS